MNLFEIVKYGVSCREAAERYGVEVNRYGMALCPFHNDRHTSLYVADDHYHCFACGEHGDVIDFAAKLFGLPLYGAAQNEGWEKQYPYKVGKKKVYMTPSAAEAQELIRADKHPKSTRYGRQNPISERWNSEDQLRHIGLGKQRMKEYIHAVQPKLVRYTELVQEIRGKSKERKSLLAEKKETPFYLIPKQRELSRRIAELTEELEELKSEKDMLLHSLECSDDAGIATVKKDISMLEAALKKLAQHEEKYTDELNDALRQYADLKEQAAEFDPEELQDARCALRPAMERSAVDCVQSAYGNKYDPLMMYDSKRDVANLLHEEAEERSIRERLRQKQQQKTKQKQDKKKSRDSWER